MNGIPQLVTDSSANIRERKVSLTTPGTKDGIDKTPSQFVVMVWQESVLCPLCDIRFITAQFTPAISERGVGRYIQVESRVGRRGDLSAIDQGQKTRAKDQGRKGGPG